MTRRLTTLLTLTLLFGCRTVSPPPDPFDGLRGADGTVVWQEEYAFVPPPSPWQLLRLDEDA